MAKSPYKYITVPRPVAGLIQNWPATDIPPEATPDCLNVFFEDGIIKKRFGYGAAENVLFEGMTDGDEVSSDDYGKEICDIFLFQDTLAVRSESLRRYMMAASLHDVFRWDPTNTYWAGKNTGRTVPIKDDWTGLATARSGHGPITFTSAGGANTMTFSYDNRTTADLDMVIEIDASGTPDTFIWSINGGSTWHQGGVGFGAKGTAGSVNTSITNIDLNDGGTDYCFVRFSSTTAYVVGDKWETTYTYGANTVAVDTDAADYKKSPNSLNIGIVSGHGLGTVATFVTNADISASNTISFWIRSDTTLAAGDLELIIYDINSDNGTSAPNSGTPFWTELTLPALTANTWKFVQLGISATYGDFAHIATNLSHDYSASSDIGIQTATDLGVVTLHVDLLNIHSSLHGEPDTTKTDPTISNAFVGNITVRSSGTVQKA